MKEKLELIDSKLSGRSEFIQLSEECAELIQACTKLSRYNTENRPKETEMEILLTNLEEEIADVMLCVKVLNTGGWVRMNKVEEIANHKLDRWYNRLSGDWSE